MIGAYGSWLGKVASREDRLVITHGEPHAANVMGSPGGLVLVDWDTVLLAPPERDLWGIADDESPCLTSTRGTAGVEV